MLKVKQKLTILKKKDFFIFFLDGKVNIYSRCNDCSSKHLELLLKKN